MNSLPSQIIVDILNNEMAMPANSVWLRDQNRKIPNDNGLYIIVGMVAAFPIGNVTYMKTLPAGTYTNWDGLGLVWDAQGQVYDVQQIEVNEVTQQENIQIDILSRSNNALTRNWEIIAAMQSFYAQQQQEKNNFKIFRIPRNFINTSSAEGGSQLNRYTTVISCIALYRKSKAFISPLGDYYDDFSTRVDTEQTIANPPGINYDKEGAKWDVPGEVYDERPLIEFEIDSEGILP